MLRIRLSRVGKKKQSHFRVVVADIESPRDGRIVESIGHYTPLTDPSTYKINEERALYWLSVGAQPTDAVRDLLRKQGTYERLERLRAGEPLEALVAEYEGEPEEEAAPAVEEDEVTHEEPVSEAEAEAEEAAEVPEEESPVEEAVEAVSDAADEALAAVEEVVDEATDVAAEAAAEAVGDDAVDEEE